jgi:uncharacterized protein (DUF2235 family)
MEKYKFHDTKLSSTIENAYHALAIDERRKLFIPTLWEKSDEVKNNPNHPQKMEQRWFIGAHSNVGGGYADSHLSDIALKWLVSKAAETGLYFNPSEIDAIKPDPMGLIRNSYTWMYAFWNKVWRKIKDGDPDSNQTVDDSVFDRYKSDAKYRPASLKDSIKIK